MEAHERVSIAQALEGHGCIVNEHYTRQEYIRRRHGFLGGHPDWQHVRPLLPKIYREVEVVFASEYEELSAQLLRWREIHHDVDPILPFSTTSNTATLDNFSSYGSTEWTGQRSTQECAISNTQCSPLQSACPQHGNHRFMTLYPNNAASEIGETEESVQTQVETVAPFRIQKNLDLDAYVFAPELLSSALKGQLVNLPVDSSRGKKRQAPEQGETEFLANLKYHMAKAGPAETPPVAKKARLHVPEPRSTSELTPSANCSKSFTQATSNQRPQRKACQKQTPNSEPPEPKPRALRREVSEQASTQEVERESNTSNTSLDRRGASGWPDLESIITGESLPSNRREAVAAASLHRERIFATQRAMNPRVQPHTLEHPPEFFRLPPPSQRWRQTIRCVCGARHDDCIPGEEWVACDDPSCGVWQHVECVGAAVESDPDAREEDGYLCHACDPWRHREVIAMIRRGEEIGGREESEDEDGE